jgi:hypothetical protein
MATVRLEFDLDPEVYPELHAALSALRSTRARAERMRQLAAAGLVWEKVRLQATVPAMPAAADGAARADAAPAPAGPAEPLPPIDRRAASSRRARALNGERRRVSDLVDLALDAGPSPVPPVRADNPRGRPSRRDVEQVIRELPVLVDVVEDVQPLPSHEEAAPADLVETPRWASMNAYPDDLPGEASPLDAADDEDADTAAAPEAVLHVTALSHKPATRTRLMRMKERGLFKNG